MENDLRNNRLDELIVRFNAGDRKNVDELAVEVIPIFRKLASRALDRIQARFGRRPWEGFTTTLAHDVFADLFLKEKASRPPAAREEFMKFISTVAGRLALNLFLFDNRKKRGGGKPRDG